MLWWEVSASPTSCQVLYPDKKLFIRYKTSERSCLFFFIPARSPTTYYSPAFLNVHFHQEWEMLIKFNEIDICINRSEKHKRCVAVSFILSPTLPHTSKENSSRCLKAFWKKAPAPASHRLLPALVVTVCDVKLRHLLSSAHCLAQKSLTFLNEESSCGSNLWISLHRYSICTKEISVSNYVQVGFVTHILTTCLAQLARLTLTNIYLTLLVFVSGLLSCGYLHCVYSVYEMQSQSIQI